MDRIRAVADRLFFWLRRIPFVERVLIGNSFVILIGAIGGTILTRYLTLMANWGLILLFSSLGILISLGVNYWITQSTLKPLRELIHAVDQVKEGQAELPQALGEFMDPDISRLVTAMNSLLARLEKRTAQLRALSERVINAQEEERVRIARNLHDDTAQSVSSLIIQLERIESLLPAKGMNPEEETALRLARERLAEARQLAANMLESLREIIWDLRPAILDDLGLIPAIRWYARAKLEQAGVKVDFALLNPAIRLQPALETMLFRVVQEAVNNVLRHADARQVRIQLIQKNSALCLEVQDDGRGFDVNLTTGEALSRNKLGLLGIKERVSIFGGGVNIRSSPGQGACLQVCIPLLEGKSDFIDHERRDEEDDA